MNNLKIRPVAPADAIHLQRTCWPQHHSEHVQAQIEHYHRRYQRGQGWGIVADKDNQPIAFGQLLRYGSAYEICDLIVMEQWRSHGVGTALIHHLIHLAAQNGIQTIEIGAALSNPRALALYQRLGFTPIKQITMDIGSGPEPIQYLAMHVQKIRLV